MLSVCLGMREAEQDWLSLGRGLPAPLLIVADGAPGLIAATEQLWPGSDRQRCTVHRLRNVLAKLPERKRERVRLAYWRALDEATDVRDGARRLRALISELDRAGPASYARFHGKGLGFAVGVVDPERSAGSGAGSCRAAWPQRALRVAPHWRRPRPTVAGRRLGLPVGDELAVGPLGLLGERPLAPTDLLQRVGRRPASLSAPSGGTRAQLERPQFLGGQRRPLEGVVLALRHHVPAEHGELARSRHHRDLHAAPGAQPLEEGPQRTCVLAATQAASTSMPRACVPRPAW